MIALSQLRVWWIIYSVLFFAAPMPEAPIFTCSWKLWANSWNHSCAEVGPATRQANSLTASCVVPSSWTHFNTSASHSADCLWDSVCPVPQLQHPIFQLDCYHIWQSLNFHGMATCHSVSWHTAVNRHKLKLLLQWSICRVCVEAAECQSLLDHKQLLLYLHPSGIHYTSLPSLRDLYFQEEYSGKSWSQDSHLKRIAWGDFSIKTVGSWYL